MIVKLSGVPTQPADDGVTVIVPLIGAAVALVPVKDAILPLPEAPRPIAVLLFVQLKVVPATGLLKFAAAVNEPLHTVWSAIALTVPVGLTVIVKLTATPVQLTPPLLKLGVTVIVATCGTDVLFIAIKAPILPVPPAASPIVVLVLLQLYTVPGTGPLIVTAAVVAPLQRVWLPIAFTLGVGLTVIVKITGTPTQPVGAIGVTVTVATTGTVPALTAIKPGILPTPAPPSPIEGWLFVHWKNTPGWEVVNVTGAVSDPLHNSWLPGNGGFITGVGLTVIVNVIGVPTQVTPPLV